MELVMFPASGPPVSLTGELSEEGMQSGELESRAQMDFPPRVNAPDVEAIDYGNRQNVLSFVVERTWPTPGDASAYWLAHAESLPRTGRLRMRAQQTGGEVVVTKWLNGAGIISARGTFDGCATTFRYQIGGGLITTT